MTKKMLHGLISDVKNTLYCFVATKSPAMVSKIRSMGYGYSEMDPGSVLNKFVYRTNQRGQQDGVISLSVINDLGDYNVGTICSNLVNGSFSDVSDSESLISLSCSGDKYFACMTDFWGIMSHYWYKSDDTFICSNNIYLISALIGSDLSVEALYEYMFFLAPVGSHTWFKDIKCLLPGQQLIFDMNNSTIKLSEETDFSCLRSSDESNLVGAVKDFFSKVKANANSGTANYIALSAGSDSRTLLSCMRYFDMAPRAISFGKDDMIETQRIRELVKNINVPWQLVNVAGYEDNFNTLFARGTFISNGLLNPLRTHYLCLYDQITQGSNLFEGFLGSEFIKGEIAVEGLISSLHKEVIADGVVIPEVIEKYYPDLSDGFKKAMSDYITSEYVSELEDVNTEKGFKCYQQFAFKFIPSKLFVGPMLLTLANGISSYYPFLSRNILRAVFKNGYGIASYTSLRKDFIGPIKSLGAEAEIVQYMDNDIFLSVLDREIRFKDVLDPLYIAKIKKAFQRIKNEKGLKRTQQIQIDVSKIRDILERSANSSVLKEIPLNKNGKVIKPLTAKVIVNTSQILKFQELS